MNNHQFDINEVPILRLFAAFGYVLAIAIFFGTLGIAGMMLPTYWRGIKNAQTIGERAYYVMRFISMWCVVYVFGMFLIMGVDAIFFQVDVTRYFPTVSWIFMDWDMSHAMSFNMDLVWSLVLCGISAVGAVALGSEDEMDRSYNLPERVHRKNHIDDVMDRYHNVLLTDPELSPGFAIQSASFRKEAIASYQHRLDDISHRVREVHRTWEKRCPID